MGSTTQHVVRTAQGRLTGSGARCCVYRVTCSISVLICILCGSSVMAKFTLKSPRRARKLQRSTCEAACAQRQYFDMPFPWLVERLDACSLSAHTYIANPMARHSLSTHPLSVSTPSQLPEEPAGVLWHQPCHTAPSWLRISCAGCNCRERSSVLPHTTSPCCVHGAPQAAVCMSCGR